MKILVTGGAGYIGTHTCVELLKAGYEIAVMITSATVKKRQFAVWKKSAEKRFRFMRPTCGTRPLSIIFLR